MDGVPTHARGVGTKWFLSSLSTQTILWFDLWSKWHPTSTEVPNWNSQKLNNVAMLLWKYLQWMGNYRPVILTLVAGKLMKHIILSIITWHLQNNQVIKPSQHGFTKSRSLTNLISSMTRWHEEVKERLWMWAAWISLRFLSLFPTSFSRINWLLITWMGVCFIGLKTG